MPENTPTGDEKCRSQTADCPNEDSSILRSVLRELGLLMVPAGIIAAFCNLLLVPVQSTAAITIASIILIAICAHRKQINQRIPSALVSALLIALFAVFWFNYQYLILKDTGLVRWYRKSADCHQEIGKLIRESRRNIWFVGANFHIAAIDRREELLSKLDNGANLRFLIFNPDSTRTEQVAFDFGQSFSEFRTECVQGLNYLISLCRDWKARSHLSKKPGTIEIRLYDMSPLARFYFFDPDEPIGSSIFIPYMNRVNSPDLPAFLIQNVESGVVPAYYTAVLKLWEVSQRLDIDSAH